MIKKIINIKNTGKFRSFIAKSGVQFNRMNIIYSENGRGKTTLSSIFRSLNEQNPELIVGRKTLGGIGAQSLEILVDSNKHQFKNNAWLSKPELEIEIFDSVFVSQNVYSKFIEHDHKKQLYLFTIGKTGVEKADQLDKLDAAIKKATSTKKELESSIKVGVEGVLSIDDFIKLPYKENIDEEIKKCQQALLAHSKEAEIKGKALLSKVELPTFDRVKFESNITGRTISDVLDTAEVITKNHIHNRLDVNGEKWLEYGVSKIKDNSCPFCEQDISSVDIIKAFRSYFSDEYRKAIKLVESLSDAFNQKCDIGNFLTFQSKVHTNVELLTFWKQYVSLPEQYQLVLDFYSDVWKEFTSAIKELIETKKRSPFESVTISDDANRKIDMYLSCLQQISDYNIFVESVNKLIEERKNSINQNAFQNLQVNLQRLKNIKLRYDSSKIELVDKYNQLTSEIDGFNKNKIKIRNELREYTEAIFRKYEHRINHHLVNCGANFKVSDFKSSFLGGKPSSNFSFIINNVTVQIGSENTPQTSASFRNTLSEGDKSSLAFAFFLAKLENDPEVENKVIIFDDPISSLDRHRKRYTADQVLNFANKVKQVIVLTHDIYFARMVWEKYTEKKTLLSQLCIKRDCLSDSIIDTWDVEEETRSDYYQGYFLLADFLRGKPNLNLRSVAMSIRPLIEGNLRIRFPEDFNSNEWLGDFIKKVRTATKEPLLQMTSHLVDLEEINDYSKRFHHDRDPYSQPEPINEIELEAYVKRTLNLIQGVHNASVSYEAI
ncbi:AAA family ATPase [Paenibacillus humicus]|uniref:AAA family ATPase n=1 Tax=Paenibacillus humicus TaxID=412861 RepID=UPI003D28EF8E